MKFDSRFSWESTLRCYKRQDRYNFLSECVILHCRKGICALATKEDNNYLIPRPSMFCLVRDGECVGTRTKDSQSRISFFKLLENSILPTPKLQYVMSEPVIAGLNIN